MNILFVNYYASEDGGAGISTYCLAKELKEQGLDVSFASTEKYPSFRSFVFKNFRYLPFFFLREIYLWFFLKKIIKKNNFDAIHCADSRFVSNVVIKLAKKMGLISVVHFRGYWFKCLKGDLLYHNVKKCEGMSLKKCIKCLPLHLAIWEIYKFRYFKSTLKTIKKADIKIAISEAVSRELKGSGILDARIIYDPIGKIEEKGSSRESQTQIYKKIKNKKVILFAGMLIYHRGIEILMEIARSLKGKRDVAFLIVGDGEMRAYCDEKINKNNLSNVYMAGQQKWDEMGAVFKKSDIFLFPSILPEPFGRVSREAMAYGIPVIVSNNGGNSEGIIDGENGFLVDSNDIEKYIEKINILLDDDGLRKNIGEAGRRSLGKYEPKLIAENVKKLYEETLYDKNRK